MGDLEQLTMRVNYLEHKLTESNKEMREIKDNMQELRDLMELHYSTKEKGSNGTLTATSCQTGPTTSSNNHQTAAHGIAFIPKSAGWNFYLITEQEIPWGGYTDVNNFFPTNKLRTKQGGIGRVSYDRRSATMVLQTGTGRIRDQLSPIHIILPSQVWSSIDK